MDKNDWKNVIESAIYFINIKNLRETIKIIYFIFSYGFVVVCNMYLWQTLVT